MRPKVSVILPVYNTAAFLPQCLDSLLNQSLEDIEVLMIDDCSTDASREIIDRYAAFHSHFRAFHNKMNTGVQGCRNLGIKMAEGEYVGFTDSDDWMDRDYFESMYLKAKAADADLLLNTTILKEHPDRSEPYQWLTFKEQKPEGRFLTPGQSANNTHCFLFLHLYKRELLENAGLHFLNKRNVHDDDYFHRISSMASRTIFAYAGPAYHYRYRSGSLMDSRKEKNRPYQEVFTWLKDYFKERLSDPGFDLKLYNRMLFSDVSETEYASLKAYLTDLNGYFQLSGVWPSDFDRYAIGHILESTCHGDLMRRIGTDPWVRYQTLERIKSRMRVKASVIVPVFNTQDQVARCLRSILDQTLHDIEVLLVNDGSTDHSLDVLEEYALEDNRVKVIDLEQNGGVSNARNTALKAARGKYVYFIDSDDWIDKGYLESMYMAIERQGTDIVLNAHFINAYDDPSKDTQSDYPFIPKEGAYLSPAEIQRRYPPVIWSRLYRRSFLLEQGLEFPIVSGGAEDIFFAYACDLLKEKVFAFRAPEAYHYYQRPTSAMHTASRGFHYIESFALLKSFLESKGVSTDGIKLFYVESLILDAKDKYDFVKSYLCLIREQIQKNQTLYNAQELFLLKVMEETGSYEEFLLRYNPNIALSFIRFKMFRK